MHRIMRTVAIIAMVAVPAWAQRIETHQPDRGRIVHIQTALNHLTVIEAGELVLTVAAGSSAFKIEWRENKVFIQPTEPNVATNLFIWTASGRLNYELEPAGSIEAMDFAVDEPIERPQVIPVPTVNQTSEQKLATEPMLGGRPVRIGDFKVPKNRVIVLLKDVFQRNDQVFIRYSIWNGSKTAYVPRCPQAFVLDVPRLANLGRIANYQLTADEVKNLHSKGQKSLDLSSTQVRDASIEPGNDTVGVVGVKLPTVKAGGHTALRLKFPPDANIPVEATLVL